MSFVLEHDVNGYYDAHSEEQNGYEYVPMDFEHVFLGEDEVLLPLFLFRYGCQRVLQTGKVVYVHTVSEQFPPTNGILRIYRTTTQMFNLLCFLENF